MIKAIIAFSGLLLVSCSIFRPAVPQPKEEFRGVWIATVANIDWPPQGGLSWSEQKKDFIRLLTFYKNLRFNAVIVQVRCAGDAIYPTEMAPWSRYLSGSEGIPSEMDEDPLEWMIDQAHLRGMQFHAWLNPYRATMTLDTASLAASHDYYRHPEWMIPYGNRYYYNPGLPDVQKHLVAILNELLVRYPVDGIHFDDYFYPYKIKEAIFADSAAYKIHSLPGQSIEDWRRANTDSLIRNIHLLIKEEKPWVQFGISPFGVWRNREKDPSGSDTRAGQTTYDDLYADPLLWMRKGWLDYIVPQVYWSMDFSAAPHRELISWWSENSPGTHLYIGNAAYKIRNNSDKAWEKKRELSRQVLLGRQTHKVTGNVFFSAKSLPGHPDIARQLKDRYYPYPALPPPTPGPHIGPLEPPQLDRVSDMGNYLKFRIAPDPDTRWQYAVYYAAKREKRLSINDPAKLIGTYFLDGQTHFTLGKQLLNGKKILALTFLDSYGNESEPIVIHLNQIDPNGP